jgi:hypothetical protein
MAYLSGPAGQLMTPQLVDSAGGLLTLAQAAQPGQWQVSRQT